jgi:hypothetical protein
MGYANDAERLSTSDAEETLPLYEDSQGAAVVGDLTPPEPKATPDEVRDFIVEVMRARGIGLDYARRVAARWTIGTGRELRQYPPPMFKDIFGPEDGWIVYKAARSLYYEKEKEKKKKGNRIERGVLGKSFPLPCYLFLFLI